MYLDDPEDDCIVVEDDLDKRQAYIIANNLPGMTPRVRSLDATD